MKLSILTFISLRWKETRLVPFSGLQPSAKPLGDQKTLLRGDGPRKAIKSFLWTCQEGSTNKATNNLAKEGGSYAAELDYYPLNPI